MGLCRESNIDEIWQVVFPIDPDSASGPDGFCSKFYQSCSDIICYNLLDTVLDYFKGSAMPKGFQSILFVLFPKKHYLACLAYFHPICLCNVSNKVLAKLLIFTLAPLRPHIISLSHSGLVFGRVIHNFLFVQVLIHDLNHRTRGSNVVLKLDMAKTYDRTSWPFII